MLLFMFGVAVGLITAIVLSAFHECKQYPITRCINCEVLEGMLDDSRNA
ncbi:MAG: hypothetical protein MN733_02565 [Nitrososphaera sp.]|nr:hypothetical protein [Nitrososphaera sp.]